MKTKNIKNGERTRRRKTGGSKTMENPKRKNTGK
jgi:hypothetical protein